MMAVTPKSLSDEWGVGRWHGSIIQAEQRRERTILKRSLRLSSDHEKKTARCDIISIITYEIQLYTVVVELESRQSGKR